MATLSIRNPTLLDLAQAQDPNGKIAIIIEILKQTNEILEDMEVCPLCETVLKEQ